MSKGFIIFKETSRRSACVVSACVVAGIVKSGLGNMSTGVSPTVPVGGLSFSHIFGATSEYRYP